MKSNSVPPQWEDAFAALESGRRLAPPLLYEAALTRTLTRWVARWVIGLTVAVAVLTVLLATAGGVDPLHDWRALDEAVHAGIYGPG